MCRLLAYIGPEIPLESLLLEPENSLINQSLDPELHPLLHLAGWGFGAWSEHLLKPAEPFLYHRPMAAFYDDNAKSIIPSLQGSTLLAHIRAAGYDSSSVLADENCHPFSFNGTMWTIAQNGALPNWRILQRALLPHCTDRFLKQMKGTTDTEFLYVLLLSLLKGDRDEDVKKGFEDMLKVIREAMEELDLFALTKLKIALVSQDRIIGVNYGCDETGNSTPNGDWRELRKSGHGTADYARSMLLEPMYALTGKNFEDYANSYDIDVTPPEQATSAIFASEPLTEEGDDWLDIKFNEMVALNREGDSISQTVYELDV
ncbi:class II glutamine amidotransferase [Sulfitobacter sp. S0837]|uniref:class II glutamine amidotransferase n=1 Tax=Sulfitobacter maritimus TaxID=2741719 RepID=UPI00158372EF|nr:class II glutamine amidotransferase [Sulfitobacter maritimus]NUH66448.1 class II glutamine amidotransferase [Sulfitobacter maritimus]